MRRHTLRASLLLATALLAGVAVVRWRARVGRPAASVTGRAPQRTRAVSADRVRTALARVPAPRAADSAATPAPAARLSLRGLLGEVPVDRPQLVDLVQLAANELDPAERARVFAAVGDWLAASQLGWSHDLLAALPSFTDRYGLMKATLEALVERNLSTAAAWVSDLKETALRDGAYNELGMQWASRNPSAAAAWAASVPAGAARVNAFEGVAWAWTQSDAAAAYSWAAKIDDAAVRDQVLVKMAKIFAVQDGKTATEWAQQFPDGSARDSALHYAVFQWAAQDLPAAAQWVAQLPDPAQRAETELAVARSWATYEGKGATTWAAGIADPTVRSEALSATLQKWATTDAPAASQWLAQNPAQAGDVELFRAVALGLATTDAAAAQRWVAGATDPTWRAIGEQIISAHPPVAGGSR